MISHRIHLYIFGTLLSAMPMALSANNVDSLLRELDKVIDDRPKYVAEKEERISNLRFESQWVADGQPRFDMLGKLIDEYNLFDSDSALAICEERNVLAHMMGDKNVIAESNLSTAYALCKAGMYKEAVDLVEPIKVEQLPRSMHEYYYHVVRSLYGQLADFSVREQERQKYEMLTMEYRDSLLNTFPPNAIYRNLVLADRHNALNEPEQAIECVERMFAVSDNYDDHTKAIAAYTLAEAYRQTGDIENQKWNLIYSAIADMKSGSREYISLRKLALLLYEEGEIDRASRYLRQCMSDAQLCRARFRMLETDDIYNAVNEVYLTQIDKQKSHLRWTLIGVAVLALLLLWAVMLIAREMGKVGLVNSKLTMANRAIAETSTLKEEYIAQYMDQCSTYIDKLDQQRRALSKIAKTGTIDDLKKYNKTLVKIDEEIRQFYASFDQAFLKIFPTFVEDFNTLLRHDERIEPKIKGELTPELRIFALIRLGITDSVKIARFLRYSLATIYNYRTRVRNRAIGDRNRLEIDLMHIGRTV